MFYFAYGMNLDPELMERRCPGCRRIGKAILKNYRLCFRGCATIEESHGDEVWGAVYEINAEEHLWALNQLEGYPRFYSRIEVELRLKSYPDDTFMVAMAYQMNERLVRDDRPLSSYLAIIMEGCRDWGIPDSYIEEVEKLAMT